MPAPNAPRWSFLLLILFFTLIVRVGIIVSDRSTLQRDPDAYARLAIGWAHSGTYGFAPAEYSPKDASSLASYQDENLSEGSAVIERATPPLDRSAVDTEVSLSPSDDWTVRPTAYRPPLYPWLLSWLVINDRLALVAVAGLHVLLGLATVAIVYCVAAMLDQRWPVFPALAVACDPILLRGSQLVMTETTITFLTVAIWAMWLYVLKGAQGASPELADRIQGVAFRSTVSTISLLTLGLLIGLAVLLRPTMLPFAFLVLVILTAFVPAPWRARVAATCLVGACILLCVVPWGLRNRTQLGTTIFTTSHGGYTLWLANNDFLYDHLERSFGSRDWDAREFHRAWADLRSRESHLDDEVAEDRSAQRAAMETIERRPWAFLKSCAVRIAWLWAPWPNEGGSGAQLAIGVWYVFWFVAALCGAAALGSQLREPAWLVPLALLLSLTAIHAIYWSNMRMRAPVMPVVYVLAASLCQPRKLLHQDRRHAAMP